MNHLISLMIIAALMLLPVLAAALCARRASHLTVFANIAEGTHTDSISKLTDASIATRHLLYKVGSDATHIAISGATDLPIGVVADEATAAEEWVSLDLLGSNTTRRMVASEAMATTGVSVYAAASGKIALSGTVKVGTLLQTASADGAVVEVQSCVPQIVSAGVAVAATRTVLASENGAAFFFGHATEFVMTLPAPFLGARYSFICTAAPASASYTIVTNSSANIIHGVGVSSADAGGNASSTAGTAADTITFVDGQAKVGDRVELTSDGTNWYALAAMSDEDAITFTVAS